MILKSFEVNKIFDSKSSFFLFYGENKGLKDLIIEKHIIEKFDGSVEKYEEKGGKTSGKRSKQIKKLSGKGLRMVQT